MKTAQAGDLGTKSFGESVVLQIVRRSETGKDMGFSTLLPLRRVHWQHSLWMVFFPSCIR